jgi:hypothetical protein
MPRIVPVQGLEGDLGRVEGDDSGLGFELGAALWLDLIGRGDRDDGAGRSAIDEPQ